MSANDQAEPRTDGREEELFALIEQKSGIYVEPARRDYLTADLLAQQTRSSHPAIDEYLDYLRRPEGQKELDHLVDIATNNETYFFREPNHFRALTNHILPALVAARRSAITIWSAGCSTGEEPYSIAMAVLKMGEHQQSFRGVQVKILGTDVSPRAIEKARQGHYTKNSFRAVSESDLASFFLDRPRSYEVKEAVRDLCDFKVMNLLQDTGDSFFEGLDVIFCRNVTIYFREATIQRLNRRLANSLREGGYLIFGATETLQHQSADLNLVEVEGSFLYRKGKKADDVPAPAPRREASGRHKKPAAPASSGRKSSALSRAVVTEALRERRDADEAAYARAMAFVKDERYAEAMALLSEASRLEDRVERRINALALLASIHMSREEWAQAQNLLGQGLSLDPLRADLYILSGLLLRYQKDHAGALGRLKKAAFIRPGLYLVHFHLGETYRSLGQAGNAERAYRNALRLLTTTRETLPESLLVATAGFSKDYIARVCERYGHGR